MSAWHVVAYAEVQPGDWALHNNGELDAREVARVDGDDVWLEVHGSNIGPLPLKNYTYSREVKEESPRDVVCPTCNAQIGKPCTYPTNDGRADARWYHLYRGQR